MIRIKKMQKSMSDSHINQQATMISAMTYYSFLALNKTSVPSYRKRIWTREEEDALIKSISLHGTDNWSIVASEIDNRNGKQCRERWLNHLNPSLNKEMWNQAEDNFIIEQQTMRGNAWSTIAKFLPGRSSNAVKNRFCLLMKPKTPMIPSPNSNIEINMSCVDAFSIQPNFQQTALFQNVNLISPNYPSNQIY
jgi:hypothetical protein